MNDQWFLQGYKRVISMHSLEGDDR